MTDQDQMQAAFTLRKPLLPPCFLHWAETADEQGQEFLRFTSWRRNLTLQGQSFQEFEEVVLPLLNGQLDVDEICEKAAHLFAAGDLLASLKMLADQGILVEGDGMPAGKGGVDRTPQLGWLSETAPEGMAAQKRLEAAHVVVFGAGAHGAAAARALAAAGIGQLTIVDPNTVAASDLYFSGLFRTADIGKNRAAVLADVLQADEGLTRIVHHTVRPTDPNAVMPLISGAHLALCCVDSGEQATALYLNMACKAAGLPWIAGSLEGTNIVVGPGFFRHDTGPCYMCWHMREMSAAQNQFAHGSTVAYLGNLQKDLSGQRENLAASADIAGGMLAAEAMTWLSGTSLPSLDGCFLQITIPGLHIERHTVLRKPGCPACAAAKAAE